MKMFRLSAVFIFAVSVAVAGYANGESDANSAKSSGVDELDRALDRAIRETSDYLNNRIPKGTKVVFLNVTSDWPDLSEYILSGLMENGVNDEAFSVVDRQQIDAIRSELNFQWSGEVSDKSAQEIGQMLGAQTIVSGSVTTIGTIYRIQTRAIAVQTAAVQGLFSQNVDGRGATIAALTQRRAPAGSQTTTTASAASSTAARATSGTTTGTQTAQAPAAGGTSATSATSVPQTPSRVTPLRWSIMDYKDQWGDSIGNYVEYDGNITGSYSNIWDSNISVTITNFRFSRREGLAFYCRRLESFMNYNGDLYIKDQNGDERKFAAVITGNNGGLRVAFSQTLVDYLIKGNPERVMFTSSGQSCQFEFPPRFAEAYSLLQASE